MIEAQAKHCNEKKNNAKGAGDISVEMFFVAFLQVCQSNYKEISWYIFVVFLLASLNLVTVTYRGNHVCWPLDRAAGHGFDSYQ